MNGYPNIIDGWNFAVPVRQRYDYSIEFPYSVDRWRQAWKPEVIRQWKEWKRLRDEWAQFLRAQSTPWKRPLRQLLQYIPNFP